MRFLLALSTLATLLPLLASPAVALPSEGGELETRTTPKHKCKTNEYYWFRLSICIPKSGIQLGVIPRDTSCPKDWNWHAPKKCCIPARPDCDGPGKEPVCKKGKWNKKKTCCETQPPHNPQPSGKYNHGKGGHKKGGHKKGGKKHKGHNKGGHKGGYNNKGSHKSGYGSGKNKHHHRELSVEPRSLMPLDGRVDAGRCPKNLTACPATSAGTDDDAWECLDTQDELSSCGGCTSLGQGQNCLLIPGAVSLTCDLGACRGFIPSGGNSCVPVPPLGSPDSQTPL